MARGTGWDMCRQLGLGADNTPWLENTSERDELEMSQLRPREVAVAGGAGAGSRVVCVAAGVMHSCALTDAGVLSTWGGADGGALGHGPVTESDDEAVWNVVAAPRSLARSFPTGARVTYVAAGEQHTCCITAAGGLYSWGNGGHGRLGHGDEKDVWRPRMVRALGARRIVGADCGTFTTAAVDDAGVLLMCGQLPTVGDNFAFCDITGTGLPFKAWWHRTGSGVDLCQQQYELLSPEEQSSFTLVSSVRVCHARLSTVKQALGRGGVGG